MLGSVFGYLESVRSGDCFEVPQREVGSFPREVVDEMQDEDEERIDQGQRIATLRDLEWC